MRTLHHFWKEEVRAELKDGYLKVSAVKDLDEDEKDKETGKYIRRNSHTHYLQHSFFHTFSPLCQLIVKSAFSDFIIAYMIFI